MNFTVSGPPAGYLRITQRQLRLLRVSDWKLDDGRLKKKRAIQRYHAFRDAVRWAAKPFINSQKSGEKVFIKVVAYFDGGVHPDPDNVLKAVQDAIFANDKHVAGSVDFYYDPGRARVEVEIVEF